MCQLKLLLSVGEALQVMQSMFPPPPAADETLPQDARIGHVLFAVNLESMEVGIGAAEEVCYGTIQQEVPLSCKLWHRRTLKTKWQVAAQDGSQTQLCSAALP